MMREESLFVKKKTQLRPAVLLVPSAIFIVVIILSLVIGQPFTDTLTKGFEILQYNLGWVVSLTMLLFVAFVAVVIFHPIGKIKLGGPNAKPKMSYWQWFVVSLCAGIGTGVVFWGAVEPLVFTFEPAPSLHLEPGSNEAVIWAMRTTFMHWTLTPYAIYVAFGLVLAYVIHNMRKPYNVSSGLIPVVGEKLAKGKLGTFVDMLTCFALIGGVAGSLGYGILQLSTGMDLVFGIEPTKFVYFIVAVAIFAAYTSTAISGLNRGIMWLGDKNAWFYVILLLFLLICGPASCIFNLLTQSLGSFFNNFVESMTFTAPFPDSELWPQWWDQYWWVDWLSYGPLMGLFFVRLGYGRTLREFVVVNWLMPCLFGFIWFAIFGGTVLYQQFYGGVDYYSIYLEKGMEAMTLEAFNSVPFAPFVKAFMLLIIAVSFITLANSMISTIASMSIKNSSENEEAPFGLKLFWGIIIAAAALVFTLAGGIDGVKMVKTFAGFPIVFLGIVMIVGFIVYMAKRPRDAAGNFEYEEVIANAPDNGEPCAPPSPTMEKLKALFHKNK